MASHEKAILETVVFDRIPAFLEVYGLERVMLYRFRLGEELPKGVYTTSVNENTLDEAPMAYKSLADIIDVIRESVDVIDVMKPVYNFKASE